MSLRLRLGVGLWYRVLRIAKLGAWRNRTTTTGAISVHSSVFGVIIGIFTAAWLRRAGNCGFRGWRRIG